MNELLFNLNGTLTAEWERLMDAAIKDKRLSFVDLNRFDTCLYEYLYHVSQLDSLSNPYIPYQEYIRSDEWKGKSELAKKRVGYRCQVCNKSAKETTLDTHHRTYERLGREDPEDLTVLCRRCHSLYEANKDV